MAEPIGSLYDPDYNRFAPMFNVLKQVRDEIEPPNDDLEFDLANLTFIGMSAVSLMPHEPSTDDDYFFMETVARIGYEAMKRATNYKRRYERQK